MMVLEHDLIEIDHCPECKGVWLDKGELELLLGAKQEAMVFLRGGTSIAAGEKPRRCPICRGKMRKETTRGTEPVTYDVCEGGHGMWFDRGELSCILEFGSSTQGSGPVVGWLREVFCARNG